MRLSSLNSKTCCPKVWILILWIIQCGDIAMDDMATKFHKLRSYYICRLEIRRLQYDLIWCYKILFGHVEVRSSDLFDFRVSSTRGHPYKLFKHHCSNTTRSVFFTERVINVWNSLPPDIVNFSTSIAFKRSINTAKK